MSHGVLKLLAVVVLESLLACCIAVSKDRNLHAQDDAAHDRIAKERSDASSPRCLNTYLAKNDRQSDAKLQLSDYITGGDDHSKIVSVSSVRSKQLKAVMALSPKQPESNNHEHALQMKKIGLEIPESTRKDMEQQSIEPNPAHQAVNQRRTKRRILESAVIGGGAVVTPTPTPCATPGFNSTAGNCVLCTSYDIRCLNCNESAKCISCSNSFAPTNGVCVCSSPKIVVSGVCVSCSSNCRFCGGNPSTCTGCADNRWLSSSTCVPCGSYCTICSSTTTCGQCNDNYEPTPSPSCSPCGAGTCSSGTACNAAASPCSSCSVNVTRCTACIPGYVFVASLSKCYKICEQKEFYDAALAVCVACPDGCTKCYGETTATVKCYECESTHVLLPTYSCQLYAAPDDTKYRLSTGLLSSSVAPANVRYTRNEDLGDGDTAGRYTINPTTLAYMPCAAPMSTCVRVLTKTSPLTCAKNSGFFNNSCVAKFASGFVNSTSMQVVASPDPKVLFYDSRGAIDCSSGYSWTSFTSCTPMKCQTPFTASGTSCIPSSYLKGCIISASSTTCTICSEYFFLSSGTCTPTYSNCLTATGTTVSSCVFCAPGMQRREDGKCSPVCPENYTLNSATWTCEIAPGNCRTYERDDQCTSCLEGYYLDSNRICIKPCSEGFYWNTTNQNCSSCGQYCTSCTNDTVCLRCIRGSNLTAGVCSELLTCYEGCQKCEGTTSKDCFSTLPGYYLNYSNEVVKYTPYCDYGKYYDSTNQSCQACHESCETCRNSSILQCYRCAAGYMRYGSLCVNPSTTTCKLYQGETFDAEGNMTCVNCSDPKCNYCPEQVCQECTAGYWPSSGTCTVCNGDASSLMYCHQINGRAISCKAGYKLINNQCVKKCSAGFYRASSSSTCGACSANCAACSYESSSWCTSCLPGDILYYPTSGGNPVCTNNQDVSFKGYYMVSSIKTRCLHPALTCIDAVTALSCYDGYYLSGASCEACADRCLTCSGAASNCTSCHMGYTYDGALGTCTAVCERYEYLDTASLECIPCSRNCRTCDYLTGNGQTCTACFNGFFLESTSSKCMPCHHACVSCTGSGANECTSCFPEFTLQGKTCITEISSGAGAYYNYLAGGLSLCHKYCQDCAGPTGYNCTSCLSGFTFVQNTFESDLLNVTTGFCKSTCPTGLSVEFEVPNECSPCHATCASCSGPGEDACLTCPTGRVLLGSRCLACHPSCASCAGLGPTDCTTCFIATSSVDPVSKFCMQTCTGSQKFNVRTQACSNCYSTCQTCFDSSSTSCVTCAASTPNLLTTGECIMNCSVLNKVYMPQQRACLPCHEDCKSCFGLDRTHCRECATTDFLVQNGTSHLCQEKCDNHTFKYNTTHCLSCHQTCESCTSLNDTSCLTCYDGTYLQPDKSCKSTCPETYFADAATKECLKCGNNCKWCSKPGDAYGCSVCYDPRYLRDDHLCAKICDPGFYFYDDADDCYKCHEVCKTCSAGGVFDCDICAQGLLRYYTGECLRSCPSDSAKKGLNCERCHRSCLTCKDTGVYDCLTCQSSLFLTTSGQCNSQCDPHEVAETGQKCELCDPSCDTCSSPRFDGCLSCMNASVVILSNKGVCIDCLRHPEYDMETCWFSVPLALTQASSRSMSLAASTSVKLTFARQSTFMPRISVELLSNVLQLDVEKLQKVEWTWKLRSEGGDYIIDLYFLESKPWTTKLSVSPKEQVILKNAKSGVAELIFWNSSATYIIPVRKAPDAAIIGALESAVAAQGSISSVSGATTGIMSVFVMFSTGPAGGILLKLVQVFKQLSRLRLLGIFFGSYLEMCLRVVSNLYPLGGDNITNVGVKANPSSRGKLDMYKLGVMSADLMAWKYAIYFLLMSVRIYRSKVRAYASHAKLLNLVDQLMDTVGEKCRTLIIAVVGIDIAFYSIHCLSHMDLSTAEGFISKTSFTLSFFTLSIMTADLISLFIENKNTTFAKLRGAERVKRVVLERADRKLTGDQQPMTRPKKGSSNDSHIETTTTDGTTSPSSTKQSILSKKKPKIEVVCNDEITQYLYGYRQQKRVIDNPSAEQFFGNGIKLHKLRTPEGRYYNTVAMIKLFLLEPIFINMQLFPATQMLTITIVQATYFAWVLRVAFLAKVFQSRIFGFSAACNELAVMMFMLTGSIFALAGGVDHLSDAVSNGLQLTAVVFIVIAVAIGLVDFFARLAGTFVNVFKSRKLNKLLKERAHRKEEQGLVRHRVIGRDLPGAEPPVPPVDADMSSSVADIKANQVGQSAKPVLGKTRLAPGKRLSRPPLQPLARK